MISVRSASSRRATAQCILLPKSNVISCRVLVLLTAERHESLHATLASAIFSSFIALAAPALSENARSVVDIRDAEVEGLRLGMGYQEAVEVYAQRYGLTWEQVDAEITKSENRLLGTAQAQWIAMTNGTETLSVNFATRIPLNPDNPLVVDTITYQLSWSQKNEAEMAKAAIAKYGLQSNAPADGPM